jgi:succinate-semialdehyde dehydrogenase / glutarate-semialdehyde dehydrogenase
MLAVNPTTEEPLGEYAEDSPEQAERKIQLAAQAFVSWHDTDLERRAQLLAQVARRLRASRDELARLMALEMGKPIAEGLVEVDKCAWVCEHYAENAAAYLRPEQIQTDASESFVRYEPLGPVLAIMPWNFPLWQVFRFAAPALAAGNVALLKHAPNVPGCAQALERLFLDAGFAPGVFVNLTVPVAAVDAVIAHPEVRAVTLTGSVRAGRAVAATAGREIKTCVLELGGSDPFLVLADADLETAARQAARARTINGGQSCIAAKRFIVVDSVAERFEELFRRELEALRVGDPLDPKTQIGPMARLDLLEALHAQVVATIRAGAKLITGGARPERRGYFYPPTLLTGVQPGMAAFDEETFGPVAAVCRARDTEEAIALANRSAYGLGASLWSADKERAAGLARRVEAGHVAINGIVKSDPRLPFGGIKSSGFGRELGRHGILEFVNVKTVWIA